MNKLKEMLKTVRFGSITLIVQDGRVIQLEKHEKVRFR
ncbi:YezD family protein [Falsibacillus albus]